MFYFSYNLMLRYWKFSKIFVLLFLIIKTLSMIPSNAWGEEIYTHIDTNGTMVISNIYPQENIIFNTWNSDKNRYQDSTYPDKDAAIVLASIPSKNNIIPNTRNSNSYQDSTSEERLHWGRDNAMIAKQKVRYGQRAKASNSGGMDAGRYDVNIKKIASNLYQDLSTRIIIKTFACAELAGRDGSSLNWSGISGELFFQNTNKTCMVKKVYK
jgi:hypothetical protein